MSGADGNMTAFEKLMHYEARHEPPNDDPGDTTASSRKLAVFAHKLVVEELSRLSCLPQLGYRFDGGAVSLDLSATAGLFREVEALLGDSFTMLPVGS